MPSRLTAVEPEVAILGADQNERGLWGREWQLCNIANCVLDKHERLTHTNKNKKLKLIKDSRKQEIVTFLSDMF